MATAGWRGKGRGEEIPLWKLSVRREAAKQRNRSFSGGGLPRRIAPVKVSLHQIKFNDGEQK